MANPQMAPPGVDLTAGASQPSSTISWHEPHPHFVILFIGPDEVVFGIQKDLLSAQSPYFRDELAKEGADKVEYVLKVPDTTVEVFGCFQNFIYTGQVYDRRGGKGVPEYTLLLGIWKLATKLRMAPLRVAVLDAMAERRQQTSMIPGIELLEVAWKETEEGSGLRKMLIEWSAEHMRSSPAIRNEFARSLPKEILSELVIIMSELPITTPPVKKTVRMHPTVNTAPPIYQSIYQPINTVPPIEIDAEPPRPQKRARKSDTAIISTGPDDEFDVKPIIKKVARRSEPTNRKIIRRISTSASGSGPKDPSEMDPEVDMLYCKDLIHRMLSGPGFWTRLVGPFKDPVDPVIHNCPRYFDVVKRPMCLKDIKGKMNRGEYANSAEFEADIRLIFQNCFEYWTPQDQVFKDCENFEKYFNEKWGQRHKWNPPTIKTEIID